MKWPIVLVCLLVVSSALLVSGCTKTQIPSKGDQGTQTPANGDQVDSAKTGNDQATSSEIADNSVSGWVDENEEVEIGEMI